MSGICGVVRFGDPTGGPESDGLREALEAMMEAGAFRGPDGRGTWVGDGVRLGYLSLATTPGSLLEAQPLEDPETGIVVLADARIDNGRELSRRLGRPAPGADAGDAGLILEAYRRWGPDCTSELVGDFAFVLWDPAPGRLLAARDPMGMRGLYYRWTGRELHFATEAEQILAVPGVAVRILEAAVGAFLTGRWPAPHQSYFADILRVPPGHAVEFSRRGSRTWRFWDLDPGHRIRYRTMDGYAAHFRDLFAEAVRARVRGKEPVGILLSGGLDSMSIAATAGRLRQEEGVDPAALRAYSFTFRELTQCDERSISDPLARHYGIPVTGVAADDAWPLRDDPLRASHPSDPYLFGHYTLLGRTFTEARREGVRRILSGDRGDLVSGMAILDLPSLFWRGRWGSLARQLRGLAEARDAGFGETVSRQLLRPARLRISQATPEFLRRIRGRTGVHASRRRIPDWLSPNLRDALDQAPAAPDREKVTRLGNVARQKRYEAVFTPLHMEGVGCTERMHARSGQTFADPWSDIRLVEFVLAVPQGVLNQVGEPKRLTRAAMQGIIPEPFLRSARKVVPTPLFDRGLRDRGREVVVELLTDMEAARRDWVNETVVRREFEAVLEGTGDVAALWRTLSLEIWLRSHWSGGWENG